MVPDIVFTDPMHPQSVQYPHEGEEYLCIGFDCGYITKSKKLVELVEDEGLFGYSGVMELMNRMQDAFLTKADGKQTDRGGGTDNMSRLCIDLPPFAPDYSGAASAFFDLGGIIVMHDASGCTGNYTGFTVTSRDGSVPSRRCFVPDCAGSMRLWEMTRRTSKERWMPQIS